MKIIISGIITGSIILNALVFPMTSVSAHNNDLVSSAVREGFYQEIYEDDGAITYDYFENNKRIVKTVKDEYTISFESDHTTGIAQIVENGSIIETIDMNTMRDDNLNWTIDPEDEKMLSQFMKKAAFNESQDIDLPNSLKAKYEVVIENNIPVVRPTTDLISEETGMKSKSLIGVLASAQVVKPYSEVTTSYPTYMYKQMTSTVSWSSPLNQSLQLKVKDSMHSYIVTSKSSMVFQTGTVVAAIADIYGLAVSIVTHSLSGVISGVGSMASLTRAVDYYFKEDIKFSALRQGYVFDTRTFGRDVSMRTEYGDGRLSMTWDLVKGEYINPQWKITAQAYPFTVNLSYLIGEAKRIYEYQIQTFGRCLGDS